MVVLAVFVLVVLVRWQPFLAGGPSLLVLGVVAAALTPPRRRRPGSRAHASRRSAAPYPTVRRWDAARDSLAHLPDSTIPPVGRPEYDDEHDEDGTARHPWAEPGDRELVRVLDPKDAVAGDPEETMAIDMRPLLAENALLEQTMSLDMRGFLHDPGYGRG